MKILILSLLMLGAISVNAQERATKIVSSERHAPIHDGSYTKKVMVLLNDHYRTYANDIETVLDTLSKDYAWKVVMEPDSIKQYTNSEFITNVMIITRKR